VSAVRCCVLDMQSSWSWGMLYVRVQFIVMAEFRDLEFDDVLGVWGAGESLGTARRALEWSSRALKPGEKISKYGPTLVLSIFCRWFLHRVK